MSDQITLPREVLQLALEALLWSYEYKKFGPKQLEAMQALRTALAAPQPDALALAERLASGRLAIIEQLTDEVEALRRDAERLTADNERLQGLMNSAGLVRAQNEHNALRGDNERLTADNERLKLLMQEARDLAWSYGADNLHDRLNAVLQEPPR